MDNLNKIINVDRYLIKYDTMASLEHIAGVRCITAILNYKKIKELFAVKPSPCGSVVLLYMLAKIHVLRLPSSLREKLMQIASCMAGQICDWIRYHNEQIFNVGLHVEREASDFMSAITWTSRGTIDYLRSAKKLMKFDLNDDIKFRIAYAYCLNELLFYCVKGMDQAYLKAMFPEHGRDFLPRCALYYWICYLHSDTVEARRIYGYGVRSSCRVEEFLFNIFVRMPNYVPTKQIWCKLTDTEKIERTMDLVTTSVSPDLQLYFLSQLTIRDQYFVINCYVPFVYKILVNDYHVRSFYGDVIEYIWNVMTVNDFIEIVKQLFMSIDGANGVMQLKYKQVLKEFWSSASLHLRHQVLEYDYHQKLQRDERLCGWQMQSSCNSLPLNWDNNEDIVELVMSDATMPQRKCFLKSNSSVHYAIRRIKKGKYQALESFISKFLPDENDQQEYKIDVLRGEGYTLVKHFCTSEPSHSTEAFYRWCFPSPLRMRQFIEEKRADMWYKMREFFAAKQNITKVRPFLEWCLLPTHQLLEWLRRFQLDVWYDLIKSNDETVIADIEYFLDWSFDTTSQLNKAQLIIPHKATLLTKFVCGLIKRNNIQLLKQLLDWCFLYDQRQIQNFKNNFYEYCDFDDFRDLIEFIVVTRNDQFRMFNTFFGTWFGNENDFQTFKSKITQPRTAAWIAAAFVHRRRMKRADEFFKLCANLGDDQIVEFKFKIFLHESMSEVLTYYEDNHSFVRSFSQWVDPPREKYQQFEEKFLSDRKTEFKL